MASLFTPKITMPKVADPTPMPDTQDPQVLAARRKALADAAARSGRQSTILSGSDSGLGSGVAPAPSSGGDSYSSTTLGGQ